MNPLRIGIIGAGRIGKVHAHTLQSTPGVEIAAVSDIVPDAALALAAGHNIKTSTDDYHDIIMDQPSTPSSSAPPPIPTRQ